MDNNITHVTLFALKLFVIMGGFPNAVKVKHLLLCLKKMYSSSCITA